MNPVAPEVLAPAGDSECVQAAIENGADAVYFGLQHGFNARYRAGNFTLEELPDLMQRLHRRGVKGYLTLNTLAFTNELAEVARILKHAAEAWVDAVLVQDLGVARLAREISPDLPLHASTQMTLTCSGSIAAAKSLGIERVVLPREASLADIRRTRNETEIPLETFVHGALCVAYSGQCLTSESLGGRSANRGQCAQACRLPYQLYCDGEYRDLGAQQYLLSPQDLAIWDLIPELIEIGVASLKIEGRLKSAEYVAAVTSHYRRAVDAAMQKQAPAFTRDDLFSLEQTFSRGLSHGWTEGCDHKVLVPGLSSAKRGIFLGSIRSIERRGVVVQLAAPVAAGDGVVFEGNRAAKEEEGGRVFALFQNGRRIEGVVRSGQIEMSFMPGAINLDRLRVGQHLWKTDDPQLTKKLRATFSGNAPRRKQPVSMHVRAVAGEPLHVRVTLNGESHAELQTEEPLAVAMRHAITEPMLREQLGRLGQTPFELTELSAEIMGNPMIPLSILGKLRHRVVEQLEALSVMRPKRHVASVRGLDSLKQRDRERLPILQLPQKQPALWVLCRELHQVDQVIETKPAGIYVDLHDIRQYREVAQKMRGVDIPWYIATLRVQLPSETGLLRVLQRHEPSGFLVRHLAALKYYTDQKLPVVADFSLNAANELTVHWLLEQGCQRVTTSYDLNRDQWLDLVQAAPAGQLEAVVHQHMPMFHMHHCVFCSVLSPGTNKTNCGRPCDRHVVDLKDHVGKKHRLLADVGCRNTLFNGTPQSGAEIVPALLQAGVGVYRVELLDQSGEQIEQLIRPYQNLLAGNISPREVWMTLKATNRVGITRGTLEH